ncbi:MAG: tetratricopeptide repeat protein [Candidatus Neomarinimicrobiota bacterium]|nr:tetratricopeptide repeat protein [Candidatus Neomarinimicrobiota bacterium]
MKTAGSLFFLLSLNLASAQIPGGVPLLNQGLDLFRQAIQLERIGELEKAEEIYLELLYANPKDTRVFLQVKALYRKQERFDDLRSLLLSRVEIFKRDLQSHVELGEVFILTDEREKAYQYWEVLRLQFEETRSIYFMLIQMYLKYSLDEELDQLVVSGRDAFSDPAFLSLELGNIHMRNLDYASATEQYVIYASYHPNQIRSASVQILRMSDRKESHKDIEAALLEQIYFDERTVRSLYSDFLFKVQKYPEAYDQHRELGVTDQQDLERWIRFAENLRKEHRLKLALKSYSHVLEETRKSPPSLTEKAKKRLTGEALYGLALTYELQITPREKWSPLAEFFAGNAFFEDHLITLQSVEVLPLEETFTIYDSILTSLPSTIFPPQAHFRIGEIKYKITRDFDGAVASFSDAAQSSKDPTLKLDSSLRLADVLMAKGDFLAALDHLDQSLLSNRRQQDRYSLQFKLCQVQFLHGNVEEVLVLLDGLLSSLELNDSLFNDVLELKGFIEENYSRGDQIAKDAFRGYILAERLLRQGKRTEAASFFRSVSEAYPESPVADEAVFRRAELTVELGQYEKALEQLALIHSTPLGDLSTVMTGEIYDRFLHNSEEAATWYFKVLEEYPESLLTEPVRYRLREITDTGGVN